MRATGLTSEK